MTDAAHFMAAVLDLHNTSVDTRSLGLVQQRSRRRAGGSVVRVSLDRHATYVVAAYVAGAAR